MGITCPKEESDIKEEIKEEVYDASYNEADFQPKVIKLVNIKGEPFMCQICGYQSRHLRWLRYHETICQIQGPPAIPKGTLIFARPAGMGQQLMINSDLVNMVYPGQTVRLISPQLSTADLIACNQQVNMARFVTPSNQSSSAHNSLQCQLCSFVAVSTDALALHVKVNHAPVYSCNYCSFKTKMQDDIKTHLDFQCTLRPPKCYTCLLCNNIIYAVEDIEKHFREKHPKYQLTSGNIPVRMGFVPPQDTTVTMATNNVTMVTQEAVSHTPPTTDMPRRHPTNTSLQPMMMTPSRQKDILDGFHLCRYCPFKSQKPSEVNNHMKFGHLNTFDFDRKFSEPEVAVKKVNKPACPGKIDLRASCVESGNFESLEFLPPDSSPTFTSTTVIGRPKCAGKRRQDMSYVIQDKIDSIKCSPKEKNFHCEFCEFKTTTTFNLKRHIKNRHKEQQQEVREDNGVICQYCNEKMTLGNLKRHIKNRHPEMIEVTSTPTVPCPYCEFTTNSSYNLRRHAQKKHRDKFKGLAATPNNLILNNVVCQYCKFRTNSEQSLEKHVNRIHRQPLQASPQASPVEDSGGNHGNPVTLVSERVVVQTPPKEARPPKEKTLSCQSCVFRTAYSQNLRRHYEKNHRDVYPILYPERYAREEAKKATAHTECKTLTISDNNSSDLTRDTPYTGNNSSDLTRDTPYMGNNSSDLTRDTPYTGNNSSDLARDTPYTGNNSSDLTRDTPYTGITSPISDKNKSTVASPSSSIICVLENHQTKPVNSSVIQSVGEPTPDSTVNSMNTHNSPFRYKSNNVTMATNNVTMATNNVTM
ncbi:zinc finger protein 64-like [Bolinopsis microptera]|uniref:zinc finger protein 64-like n=1 Tax=Bolinopsis microptera TaxID=2820187 RepID=UPI00307A0977